MWPFISKEEQERRKYDIWQNGYVWEKNKLFYNERRIRLPSSTITIIEPQLENLFGPHDNVKILEDLLRSRILLQLLDVFQGMKGLTIKDMLSLSKVFYRLGKEDKFVDYDFEFRNEYTKCLGVFIDREWSDVVIHYYIVNLEYPLTVRIWTTNRNLTKIFGFVEIQFYLTIKHWPICFEVIWLFRGSECYYPEVFLRDEIIKQAKFSAEFEPYGIAGRFANSKIKYSLRNEYDFPGWPHRELIKN